MYITCGDDGAGVESEMGYVPNNPLFGLPLDSPQVKIFFLCWDISFGFCYFTVQSSKPHQWKFLLCVIEVNKN